MKQRLIAAVATLVVLFFAATIGTVRISAQQPTPTPRAPAPESAPDMEHRIQRLEVAQEQVIDSLKSINEQYKSIITWVGVLITVMVTIQGSATAIQLYREGRRDKGEARREEKWDRIDRRGVQRVVNVMEVVQKTLDTRLDIDRAGAQQVSSIMTVVQQTLQSHLKTEEQAREMVAKAEKELEESLKRLGPLQQFYRNFQRTIDKSREDIEDQASQWAKTVSRHDFRDMASALNSFAQKHAKFETDFEPLQEVPEGEPRPRFSARVPYIRGIAAHYANQPETAAKYLNKVVSFHQPEPGENAIDYDRRVANAYYYLGLTESNFGNHQKAIELFEKANELDLQERDFLTRVVTAEAHVMTKAFDKAQEYIDYVERRLNEIESKEGRLRNFHLRLRSRAALIGANMMILERKANWREEVKKLLEPVHIADTEYYYATATLAQVYYHQGEVAKAQNLFDQAHTSIERSGHLLTVTETRSRILLLMTAGMCCKHGPMDEGRSEELLDKADSLLDSLPRMGHQVCTVFSTLSKRNARGDTVRRHIELIRRGKVLL